MGGYSSKTKGRTTNCFFMDASLLVGTGNYYFWEPGGNLVGSDFSEDSPMVDAVVVGVFSISSFAYLVSKPKINKKRILKIIRSILRDKLPI